MSHIWVLVTWSGKGYKKTGTVALSLSLFLLFSLSLSLSLVIFDVLGKIIGIGRL